MSPEPDQDKFILVTDGATLRLDAFLVARIPGLSRRRARELIDTGRVRVNGRRARKGQGLRPFDRVAVEVTPSVLAAEREPALGILYEDAHVIAVEKPPGLPSVALRPEDRGTLGNLIVGLHPEIEQIGRRLECGAVHRLDTGTSGVMLFARTEEAYRILRRQFETRAVAKQYLALVGGRPAGGGRVTLPIAHHPRIRARMVACRDEDEARRLGARAALSRYRVLRKGPNAALVAISIASGARHQVRAHLAALGHPVIGDPLYGTDSEPTATRLMLHASRIRFRHPASGRAVVVRCALPADFRKALARALR